MSDKSERRKRIRREKRRQRRKERSFRRTVRTIFGWLLSVLIAVVLGYGMVSYCFQSVYVVGDSMNPVCTNQEKVTVNKLCYLLGSPDRYDIVAYRSVDTPDAYYDIKRVIGLPGETVQIKDGKYILMAVNGRICRLMIIYLQRDWQRVKSSLGMMSISCLVIMSITVKIPDS